MKKELKKLIFYELNEVPLRVLKKYKLTNPKSNLSYICKIGVLKNTITFDEGELHPWSTWPTVHRGVNNKIHQIKFINQDLSEAKTWPSIWEVLIGKKISIGIFGSLQSYPPIKHELVKFYLPDTFSPNPESIPIEIKPFQDFNLSLTKRNKAISRRINFKDYLKFFKLIITGSFSINTIYKVLMQLFSEIINKKSKTLRSLLQPILGFDIYMKLLKNEKPQFSTFFTNHVAGIMHRYWKFHFPEDFEDVKDIKNNFHKESINKAMKIVDSQVGRLIKFCDANNYELWIISSMGQKAIKRDDNWPEIYLGNINKIIKAIGLNQKFYSLLPAMQPDICISCKDQKALKQLIKNIVKIKDQKGKIIFKPRYQNTGNNLNVSIQHSIIAYKTKTFFINGKIYQSNDLNIEFISRDIGTAYHSKEGIFAAYGVKSKKLFNSYGSKVIDTRDFFNKVKQYFYI